MTDSVHYDLKKETNLTLVAQDLVHFLCGAIDYLETSLSLAERTSLPTEGGDVFHGAWPGSPDRPSVKAIRVEILRLIGEFASAIKNDPRGVAARRVIEPDLTPGLRGLSDIRLGPVTRSGALDLAKRALDALGKIERAVSVYADFTCGCIWDPNTIEITAPECRFRLDGTKIQVQPKSMKSPPEHKQIQADENAASCMEDILAAIEPMVGTLPSDHCTRMMVLNERVRAWASLRRSPNRELRSADCSLGASFGRLREVLAKCVNDENSAADILTYAGLSLPAEFDHSLDHDTASALVSAGYAIWNSSAVTLTQQGYELGSLSVEPGSCCRAYASAIDNCDPGQSYDTCTG